MTIIEHELRLGRPEVASFDAGAAKEWLVTNGIGGFASGTIAGARTRRYHGLLVAALKPPVARTLMVAKLDVDAKYFGRRLGLDSNEYADGTIDPHGYRYLESFELDGLIPTWIYCIADARLRKRVWMEHGANTTYISFELERASAPLSLEATPLCTYRDYHAHSRGGWPLKVEPADRGCVNVAFEGAAPCRITADRGRFEPDAGWHWNFRHRLESERGLDEIEDLFRPGRFHLELKPGESVVFSMSAGLAPVHGSEDALEREQRRQAGLVERLPKNAPPWIRRLGLAADQFIVERSGGNDQGSTVIAGYPWFSDWGRDTMIALPGLTLACGRPEIAREVLRTFAGHVSDGMLPNRFPDAGETPEYNTVDATLWYFHAIDQYLEASEDTAFGREIYPVLQSIVDWHRRGTRYSIGVDPRDGLLRAGEAGVQLTWMDAKVGDWVVTPRIGKAVEINALWHRALRVMAALAIRVGDRAAAARFEREADQVRASFRRCFWYGAGSYLYDVVDGPAGDDASLRPNQLFAVSLGGGLLEPRQAEAVVDICARELWTPHGLRSLARGDPAYVGRYGGGPAQRDSVYHQGTVWGWLLGPFAEAHFAVHRDAAAAQSFLTPVEGHLREACIGSISEIFDGDEPNAARGCFAQAWSVSEVLRAWQATDAMARGAVHREIKARKKR